MLFGGWVYKTWDCWVGGGVLIGGRGSNLRMRRDGVFPGENVSGSDAVDKSVCSLATGYDCNSHTMR